MAKFKMPIFTHKFEVSGKLGHGISMLAYAVRENETIGERSDIEMGNSSIINRWDHGIYSSVGFGYNF